MHSRSLLSLTTLALALILGGAECLGPSGPPPEDCVPETALVCDGVDVTEREVCSGEETAKESCPAACHLGRCVDCAPGAGRVCDGDDVRSIDTCGALGDVIESCSGGCRAGRCSDEDCTANAATTCVGPSVYATDSCGNVEDFVQRCDDATPCEDGVCSGCNADSYITCYDGDVYSLDSCFELGAVSEDCGAGACVASGGSVACDAGASCTPSSAITCFDGDIHYVDSCGSVQTEVQEVCPNGCVAGGGCLACEQVPDGTTCSGNDRVQLLSGCGSAPTLGETLVTCPEGCYQGDCVASGACVPAGAVCGSDGNVHELDSCGVEGAIVETCASGCADAACLDDVNPPGTTYSCSCNLESFPSCTLVGSDDSTAECAGCFDPYGEFSTVCDDKTLCLEHCNEAAIDSCGTGYASVLGGLTIECPGTGEAPDICAACPSQ